ncbi:sodium-coupled monocarboxylate transporter 2-like [Ciona intestinalis]
MHVQILYMGTSVYIPSLALSGITPVSVNVAIALTSGICTAYTVCGGLKAVVWTDTFQSVVMFIGVLAVLIQATLFAGGFENVWAALERGGRVNMWEFNLDPKIRQTIMGFIIGGSATYSQITCCSQPVVQRFMSCKSVKDARISAAVAVLPKILLTLIPVGCGAAAYAYYEHCDPLSSGKISKPDQLLPYMVLEIFSAFPGFAGLFVAAAYSGTLSTVSSGINSLSAMILEDFIIPMKPQLTSKTQMSISKITGVVLGCIVASISFTCSLSSGTVFALAFTFRGACGGPILGAYILGLFLPWCNTTGVLVGQVVGAAFTIWIALGGLIYGRDPVTDHVLPVLTDSCGNASLNNSNMHWIGPQNITSSGYSVTTSLPFSNDTLSENQEISYNDLYGVSFMYYALIGCLTTVIVGMITSLLTGVNDPKKMNPKVFVPLIDNSCFPESVRQFFRFGVPPLTGNIKNGERQDEPDTSDKQQDTKLMESSAVEVVSLRENDNLYESGI